MFIIKYYNITKVQRQKTPQGTHVLFVWDEKCCKETFGLWKLKNNVMLILNAMILLIF